MTPRPHFAAPVLVLPLLASASSAVAATTTTTPPRHGVSPPTFWYTYPDRSGNRVLMGPGSIGTGGVSSFPDDDDIRIIDVDFGGTEAHVLWAVGVAVKPKPPPQSGDDDTTFLGNGTGEDCKDEGNGSDGDYYEDEMFRFVVTLRNGTAYIVGPSPPDDDEDGEGGTTTTWVATPLENYSPLTAEQPPLVRLDEMGGIKVVSLPDATDLSPLSHPVPIPIGVDGDAAPSLDEIYVYIATNGDVVLWDQRSSFDGDSSGGGGGRELHRLVDVGALPDGRIAVAMHDDDDGGGPPTPLLALYGGSTDSFRHCVLGDCVEGTRLLLIRVVLVPGDDGDEDGTSSTALLEVEADVRLPESTGEVFEGTSPFFYRDDDDGNLVVVTTVGKPYDGARLQTYSRSTGASTGAGDDSSPSGWQIRSVGPSIGWGWRHQLFRDRFGPNPNMTVPALVDVLAPHVRLTVEFFDDEHDDPDTVDTGTVGSMKLLASTSRYTTHRIGSRVLDSAVSGDVDGDGVREAVVLDDDFRSLVGIGLRPVDDDGGGFDASEVWRLPLPSVASSNLAAVVASDGGGVAKPSAVDYGEKNRCRGGRMALGMGAGNVFRMWLPPTSRGGDGDQKSGKISSTSSSAGGTSSHDVASTSSSTTEGSAVSSGSRRGTSPWIGGAVAVVSYIIVVGALLPPNPA